MYTCIGRYRVRNHAGEKGELVQCFRTSETPSNPYRPEWGFICETCAASRTSNAPLMESDNVGAMQSDASEYRDQIASGFATGASRGYEESE